ncbi:hypothetical protein Scep_003441 [Stephania cephalantha]|uniref:BHLH domain-containing protein n=1 Tax=Stephania cephalantha TaxID=152367 RepID=A0AAP0KQH7_9MAGN
MGRGKMMMAGNLEAARKRSGGLRTKQAGRGSCRGMCDSMGHVLREALKCLCGKNRWSYAVFWKIGLRNPTLLVWEAFHYEGCHGSGFQAEDRVSILINKMMINNQVHVLGESLVGRAAFTGDHQWILQQNMRDVYLPEVMREAHHQFLAGIQTIAVIPVMPHGVVQLGSTLPMVENVGFVHEVKSLFAQLGGIPGALLSDRYAEEGCNQKIGSFTSVRDPLPVCSVENSHCQVAMPNCNQEISASQLSGLGSRSSHSFLTQSQNFYQSNSALQRASISATSVNPVSNHVQVNAQQVSMPSLHLDGNLESAAVRAQVIHSRSDALLSKWTNPNNSSSSLSHHLIQSASSGTSLTPIEQQNYTGASNLMPNGGAMPSLNDSVIVSLLSRSEPNKGGNGLLMPTSVSCSHNIADPYVIPKKGLQNNSSDMVSVPISYGNSANDNNVLSGIPCQTRSSTGNIHAHHKPNGWQSVKNGLCQALNIPPDLPSSGRAPDSQRDCNISSLKHDLENVGFRNIIHDDGIRHSSGDDLFDMLGLDSKSKQLHDTWNGVFIYGSEANAKNISVDSSACITQIDGGHDLSAANDGVSESGIFSESTDHLLDAIVSKAHSRARQELEDNISCWTTLTKVSCSSVLTDAPTGGQPIAPDQKPGKSFGHPTALAKAQGMGSSSFMSGCSKDNIGESSQMNSTYTSQISLLSEDFNNCKRDNSVSTAHSKRPDETGKSNRKRLRPGENPRPRPKDRQMIQDRLTELREIVPNGAKCSIDALLERTIKHMLFLQSVTKHADKLKHTGESKIISKDGGLLLKDSFEGGATWAFEVGPQSMVCPIIVEDLNPPRQMLVEMLCEDQGFFLEIADIIRGLGLTILKGVMEARQDKVWVRFTVEANRDVTRMEIFFSLVHMLEQVMKSNAAESKGTDGGTAIAETPYHQAFVPATVPSNSLH